jgi:hypothetical protein
MKNEYGAYEKLLCVEARQIDLVDYLASLGHQPKKTSNNDNWYLSALGEEKTPSFKVNRRFNVWCDHGTGKGGDLIDFGTLYFNCSTADLLNKLSQQPPILAFFSSTLNVREFSHYAGILCS